MGHKYIEDLIDEGWMLDIDSLIAIHLSTSTSFLCVPATMVAPCKEAIRLAELETIGELVELPAGVLWRGYPSVKASVLMDAFRLWSFLDHVEEA